MQKKRCFETRRPGDGKTGGTAVWQQAGGTLVGLAKPSFQGGFFCC